MGRRGVPPRGPRPTLAERSAIAGVGAAHPRRHCWVTDPDAAAREWPGVVIEWRRAATGWQARVAWAVLQDGTPVLVETWLDEQKVRPALP